MQFAAMMNELDINNVKVEQIVRLGKKSQSDENRPRPIKVVVDSIDSKFRIIRNAKNLRLKKEGGWSRIVVHQDLTPKQREERNKLVQEMKDRKTRGETGLTIYNGRIVTRKRSPYQEQSERTSLPVST